MLGHLFQSWSSRHPATSARRDSIGHSSQSSDLESVQEDAHTQALLFPDPSSLRSSSDNPSTFHDFVRHSSRPFDLYPDRNALNDASRIRVLVAHDEYDLRPRQALLDTQHTMAPPSSPSLSRSGADSPPVSPRQSTRQPPVSQKNVRSRALSQTIDTTQPTSPVGSIQAQRRRPHSRGTSLSSLWADPRASTANLISPFYRAQTAHLANSFASESDLQSINRQARAFDSEQQMLLDCMFGSTSFKKPQQCTKIHILPKDPSASDLRPKSSYVQSKTISLNTSVTPNFGNTAPGTRTLKYARSAGHQSMLITRVFPVAIQAHEPESFQDNGRTRLLQSPRAYAVSLIIKVPVKVDPQRKIYTSSSSDHPLSWPSSVNSEALNSLGSSANSEVNISWSKGGPIVSSLDHQNEISKSHSPGTSYVLRHWDTIVEILDQLQWDIQRKVSDGRVLETSAGASRSRNTLRAPGEDLKHTERFSTPDAPHINIGTTISDESLQHSIQRVTVRLSRLLAIRPVLCGQGRWNTWREEARWISRWANNGALSSFVSLALTAFLSTNSTWLDLIKSAVKQTERVQNDRRDFYSAGLSKGRTIVLSNDKMAARRMTFILQAFLPGSTVSSSSTSTPAMSQPGSLDVSESPLSKVSSARSEQSSSGVEPSFKPSRAAHLSRHQLVPKKSNLSCAIESSRRPSDTPNSAQTLEPSLSQSLRTPQSTVGLSNSTPVPHFSIHGPNLKGSVDRSFDGDAECIEASKTLRSNLELPSGRRVISGHQGQRIQRVERLHQENSLLSLTDPGVNGQNSETTPQERVDSTTLSPCAKVDDMCDSNAPTGSIPVPIPEPEKRADVPTKVLKPATQSPESSFQLSINDTDGIIDVDISSPGVASIADAAQPSDSCRHFPNPFSSGRATSQTTNQCKSAFTVGGYLPFVHEDLVLQAVKPFKGIENQIAQGLCASVVAHDDRPPDQKVTPAEFETNGSIQERSIILIDLDGGSVKRFTCQGPANRGQTQHSSKPSDSRNIAHRETVLEETVTQPDEAIASAISKLQIRNETSSPQLSCNLSRTNSISDELTPTQSSTSIPGALDHGETWESIMVEALERVVQRTRTKCQECRTISPCRTVDNAAALNQEVLGGMTLLERAVCHWLGLKWPSLL